MNLRKLTLRYMGWCPGIDSAARFIPDRDIPDVFVIGSGLAVILIVGMYGLSIPPPVWEPRVVYIDGVEYLDEYFNESFDYSSLRDKRVVFHQPFNRSEFVAGDKRVEEFNISRLDELEGILEELGAPKIVIGYTLWIGNCTWDDVARWFYGDSVNLNEIIGVEFGKAFGDESDIHYEVGRQEQVLYVVKYYKVPGGDSAIWSVKVSYFLPYKVTVIRSGSRRGIGG